MAVAGKAPIFPTPEAQQHYSDYGFDPQIDYFHVLHEARKHGRREGAARPPEAFRFKLQKPISKDDTRRAAKGKKRGRWWRNALLFWKREGTADQGPRHQETTAYPYQAASSPVYTTESGDGGGITPWLRSGGGGGWGGACAGARRLKGTGKMTIPYLCLRDIAAGDASPSASSAACPSPAVPMYLVT